MGTVRATDRSGEPVTYALADGNAVRTFAIDAASGTITVAGALDRAATPSYVLTVTATDGRGDAATAPLTITVTDPVPRLPAAPEHLAATPEPTGMVLQWTAAPGARVYGVDYRARGGDPRWITADDAIAASPYTVQGLGCSTVYEFRVRAYGAGGLTIAAWGAASAPVTARTGGCPPRFSAPAYAFAVADDAVVGALVGTVAATAIPAGGALTYRLTAGNALGHFALGADSGQITVAGALDAAATSAYALTVRADDGRGGVATAPVTIAVSAAGVPLPEVTVAFGQAAYTVSEAAAEGVTVTLTLSAVPLREVTIPLTVSLQGGAAAADTTGVPASVTFAADATMASFQVMAVDDTLDDDGESLQLGFGALPYAVTPGAVAVTTVTIQDDDELAFAGAPYAFTVAEDAGVGTVVGTVTATGAAEGATVSYGLTAGTAEGTFALEAGTGRLTLAWAVDYATAASYTLTVTASDGTGGTATADVTITVTEVVPPEVTVAFGQAAYTVSESATDGVTVTLTLSAAPERAVTIPLTVSLQGGAEAADSTGIPASVTFGPAATEVSFQVIPVDDTLDDDGESLQLGFGDLPAGVTVGAVAMTTVTIQDDDEPPVVPGVRLSTERLTLVEGASAQVTVRLTTRPISRVQVQFRTQAGADVRMDPVDLYFIWSTWDQPQAVTITALADEEAEAAETYKINAWVVDAIDPNYIGLGKTTVWTTVTDAGTPTALARPPPPYIQSASVAATTVTLTLSAPPAEVAQWRIEYRVGAAAAWTLAADVSAAGSADYAFTGAAGTTYEFRVRASGDGTTYAAEWSDPSNTVTATTAPAS